MQQKRKATEKQTGETTVLIEGVRELAGLGRETEKAAIALNNFISSSPLLARRLAELFPRLVDAFKDKDKENDKKWCDREVASVLEAVRRTVEEGRDLDLFGVERWIRAHKNDARAVIDCLSAEPPEQITILQLLSRAGSQKVVFLANWYIYQREVVLKRFIREDAEELIARELQANPLSMKHPNIIETHLLKNHKGEKFRQ